MGVALEREEEGLTLGAGGLGGADCFEGKTKNRENVNPTIVFCVRPHPVIIKIFSCISHATGHAY